MTVTINAAALGLQATPTILKFPDFKPSILASLVAGATYGQAGNTVTVTATAHGIVGSGAKNGYRIFWPGSAAIPAGWYDGFAYVDVNTYTFTNPTAQTIAAGTAITGTLPYVSTSQVCSLVLPGGSVGENGSLSVKALRTGDTSAGSKALRVGIDGATSSVSFMTSSSHGMVSQTVFYAGGRTSAAQVVDNFSTTAVYQNAISMAVDRTINVTLSCANASQYSIVESAYLEVVK